MYGYEVKARPGCKRWGLLIGCTPDTAATLPKKSPRTHTGTGRGWFRCP